MSDNIESWGVSHVGFVRGNNEDVWEALDDENFFIVADGMGGHRAGEVAAKEAVDALARIVRHKLFLKPREKHTLSTLSELIHSSIVDVNSIVYSIGNSDDSLRGMGTTLCCLIVGEEGVVYGHVGDSRIYRLRDGELKQLTEDHTLTVQLAAPDEDDDEESGKFIYKNILTRTIGNDPLIVPDVDMASIQDGDMYLLCSDGLTDMLTPEEIQNILISSPTAQEGAQNLVDAALVAGGIDNITLIVLKITK
jgi:PPM family protein phosphatase